MCDLLLLVLTCIHYICIWPSTLIIEKFYSLILKIGCLQRPPDPVVWIFLIVKHMKYLHLMARGKLLLKNPLNFSRKIPKNPKVPQNSIKSHEITKYSHKIPNSVRPKKAKFTPRHFSSS